MYLTAYQLVHRADSVQRYCLYTILQNYSQIFTFSGFPGGMVPLDPVPLRSIPPNLRLGPSRSCGHGRPHLSRGIMPSGHITLWLRMPFAPSLPTYGWAPPVHVATGGHTSRGASCPPGTSPSGFPGPHCGRCPLEVDTYCDIGFFCCRWCWYRDTYSGGLAP